jgi:hypothetical protein
MSGKQSSGGRSSAQYPRKRQRQSADSNALPQGVLTASSQHGAASHGGALPSSHDQIKASSAISDRRKSSPVVRTRHASDRPFKTNDNQDDQMMSEALSTCKAVSTSEGLQSAASTNSNIPGTASLNGNSSTLERAPQQATDVCVILPNSPHHDVLLDAKSGKAQLLNQSSTEKTARGNAVPVSGTTGAALAPESAKNAITYPSTVQDSGLTVKPVQQAAMYGALLCASPVRETSLEVGSTEDPVAEHAIEIPIKPDHVKPRKQLSNAVLSLAASPRQAGDLSHTANHPHMDTMGNSIGVSADDVDMSTTDVPGDSYVRSSGELNEIRVLLACECLNSATLALRRHMDEIRSATENFVTVAAFPQIDAASVAQDIVTSAGSGFSAQNSSPCSQSFMSQSPDFYTNDLCAEACLVLSVIHTMHIPPALGRLQEGRTNSLRTLYCFLHWEKQLKDHRAISIKNRTLCRFTADLFEKVQSWMKPALK